MIGAPYDDDSRWYPGEPDNLGYNVGSVYVYSPDGIGGYTETKFASSDAPVFQRFGGSIAILGDEIIIGATGDDRNGWETGAVYLYSPDGLGGYTETKITTADGASSHNYGSVAAAGNTIVIGALGADGVVPYSGAVYVYSPEPPGEAMTILDTPCPVYDSNTATGLGLSGPLAGNETRTVSVTGAVPTGQGVGTAECVPDGATAAVFTISVVDPQGSGNLRLSPAGVVPNGGVVNYAANSLNNANTVTVPLGASGQADIFANVAGTDVRLVTLGYTSGTTGLRYNSVTPCAVADSRPNQGPTGAFVGPFGPGAAYPDVDVVGTFPDAQGGGNTTCNIPAGADAVVVNLVAVGTTGGTGFLSAATAGLDPFEPATPFAPVGMNNSATTIIPLQDGEKITVDIDALTGTPSTHVRAVIVGYLDNTGDSFIPRTGCAAFDTRPGFGGSGTFVGKRAAGTSTTYQITGAIPAAQGGGHSGSCGVPAGAKSVLINLVAVQPDNDGNFRAYATGTTPTGGVVNYAPLTPPMNNANAVVIPLSTAGQLDLFVNTHTNDGTPSTHARGVILGYYK
ncbi:MAG: hypothetical protein GY724_26740 [Actinomycetia bacterium]|nr:hypothetical protein [Actinomycetes bacterium]